MCGKVVEFKMYGDFKVNWMKGIKYWFFLVLFINDCLMFLVKVKFMLYFLSFLKWIMIKYRDLWFMVCEYKDRVFWVDLCVI